MCCKSRWDKEKWRNKGPMSWFMYCVKLMRKENEIFISINIVEVIPYTDKGKIQ